MAGVGVTVSTIALVVIVTGDTHFAFEVSMQVIISPFAGEAIVMELKPVEPGIITAFLYQFINGAAPWLALVSVKTAASPVHKRVFGVDIEAECVTFGETVTVMEFELTVAGVAQVELEVSLQLITSLLFNPETIIVDSPLVPGIGTAFLNQLILGEAPPLLANKLKVAVWPAHISVLGDDMLILWVRLLFTIMYPFIVLVSEPPGVVTVKVTA